MLHDPVSHIFFFLSLSNFKVRQFINVKILTKEDKKTTIIKEHTSAKNPKTSDFGK